MIYKMCTILLSITSLFSLHGASTSWNEYKLNTLRVVKTMEGWCTDEKADRLMELVRKASPQITVEVGVFGGRSFLPMVMAMQYNNKGIGYGIDPWAVQPCLVGNSGDNYEWWSKLDLNKIMVGFINFMHVNKLDNRYCLMRMTSTESVPFFQDNSIDILHIDGNHAEDSALFDVKSWYPKVRAGGYIIFDDANWATTQKAVNYLSERCKLDPTSRKGDDYLVFKK